MSRINGIPLKEDKELTSRVEELAYRALQYQLPQFTDFLDMRQLDVAKGVLKQFGLIELTSFGGFADAERAVLCICQYDVAYDEFPICCVKVEYNSPKALSHRDFLGALMSFGIKRSKIGDISVCEGAAYIAVSQIVSKAVVSQLESVGSCSVRCEICPDFPDFITADMSPIRASVSSLRLDSVVAVSLKVSRQKAQSLVSRLGVKLNCRDVFSPDARVCENDVFSVKGYGKFKLSEVVGQSKKGKTIIIINKYN